MKLADIREFYVEMYYGERGVTLAIVAKWIKFVLEAVITLGVPIGLLIHLFPEQWDAIVEVVPRIPKRDPAAWLLIVTSGWYYSEKFRCFTTSKGR